MGLTVLNSDVCEAGAGLREPERGEWGGWGGRGRRWREGEGRGGVQKRSEVQCCRAALASLIDWLTDTRTEHFSVFLSFHNNY